MKCSICKYCHEYTEGISYYLAYKANGYHDVLYDVDVEVILQPGDKIRCAHLARILYNVRTYEEAPATILQINNNLSFKLISDITGEIFDKMLIYHHHILSSDPIRNYDSIDLLIEDWQEMGFRVIMPTIFQRFATKIKSLFR